MRKLIAAFVVLGLMAVPAMADLTPSTFTPQLAGPFHPTGEGTVGIYSNHPTYGPVLLSDVAIIANPSDIITVTFAFHWPAPTWWAIQFQSELVYDNSEIAILALNTPLAGPFAGGLNNFPGTATLAGPTFNPTTGTITVGDVMGTGVPLWSNPNLFYAQYTTHTPGTMTFTSTLSNYMAPLVSSNIYPFMQIQFHVKDATTFLGSGLDLYFNFATALFWLAPSACGTGVTPNQPGCSGVTYFYGGDMLVDTWTYHTTYSAYVEYGGNFGLKIIPEPASLSLLGLGLVSVGAGVWRRRRR